MEAVNHSQISLPKNTLDEIERKRLEAKARLEAKKKQEQSSYINSSAAASPTKCSSKEIEKKRQQALAKLEAKRLQDIVEKNRQEALKRLQVTRMKKANLVKSTLTKRL
ncbi:Agro virD5 domain containing protein [Asbolus verrucosus]|uniref:Agro virD5 domain containing protein n=1 Tax=Asbolus verrucosus TaxID=1661398 RepID=A0A482VDK4_ASBVE|nr:Agro virD5 domain containing protein [Asbolus verrucosus]